MVKNLNYATSFDEKLLGISCDVEVVVDTETGDAQATIAMRSFLRSTPAFKISLEDLGAVALAIKQAKEKAGLLGQLVDGAGDHQLNFSAGGALLIVVKPRDKAARYTLSIGMFSQEGELDRLSDKEVTDAIQKVEALKSRVRAKVVMLKN